MKKFYLLAILIAIIVVGFFWFNFLNSEDFKDNNNSLQAKKVKIIIAEKENIKDLREYSGIVKGYQETNIVPKISGILNNVYFDVGDKVKKGQLIAIVDGSELIAQRDTFFNQNKNAQKLAEETEDYYNQLVKETEENLDLAEDSLNEAKKTDDEESENKAKDVVERLEEVVESAKKLRDMQVQASQGQQETANSHLNTANVKVENRKIYAPFDGIITIKHMDIGSIVSPQNPVVSLAYFLKKEINLDVPGEVAKSLKEDLEVAIFKNDKQITKGVIKSISPTSAGITRKSQVKIIISENSKLDLGDFVSVRLELSEKKEVIVLPLSSIIKEYHEQFIFLVVDGKAEKRKVELGLINDDKVEIVEGIEVGDKAITQGQSTIQNGQLISIYE